jgi:hypothetical protein
MHETRTVQKDRVLVDAVRTSPVDEDLLRFRRAVIGVIVAVLVVLLALFLWRFRVDSPVTYKSDEDHFKYGSIGAEPGGSVFTPVGGVLPPYDIFRVLPDICPDKLPGGYASLGLIVEPGHDMPIGVSKRKRLGFEQVALNCAGCHTGTYRASPQDQPKIVLGMPAHSLDLQRFFDFVTSCTLDPRFTPDNVIGKIQAAGGDLGFIDRWLYRSQVIPTTRESVLRLRARVGPLLDGSVSQWGLGRVDTFNPYKAIQFNWRLQDLPKSELIGASDYPALWNQKPRDGMQLHWDGNNTSLAERNLSAALGAGVTPVTVDHARLNRVRDWIKDLRPPRYPFAIDEALAAKGETAYREHCVRCHADHRFGVDGHLEKGWLVGEVDPIERIGTDRYRLDSYTIAFASNQYTLYPHSEHQFRNFRKTNGYANQPLDGIWARAPYLHNGSVPTLRDLLEAPDARPKTFYRGYDVYDPEKVGFRSDVAEEKGRRYFAFDTSVPGNGNGGHLYGTRLPAEDKQAIVEYMKKF